MSFYTNVEQILKDNLNSKLEYLETYYGISVEVYRTERDVHTNVYGKHAGESIEKVTDITCIIVADDFFTTGMVGSGNFEDGFLYTSYKENLVGMTIKILSKDGKKRSYKVESTEAIGLTTDIFERYKIVNLPD